MKISCTNPEGFRAVKLSSSGKKYAKGVPN